MFYFGSNQFNSSIFQSLIPIRSCWDRHWQTTRDLKLAPRAVAEYNKRNYPLEMTLMPLPTPSFKFESGPAAASAVSAVSSHRWNPRDMIIWYYLPWCATGISESKIEQILHAPFSFHVGSCDPQPGYIYLVVSWQRIRKQGWQDAVAGWMDGWTDR